MWIMTTRGKFMSLQLTSINISDDTAGRGCEKTLQRKAPLRGRATTWSTFCLSRNKKQNACPLGTAGGKNVGSEAIQNYKQVSPNIHFSIILSISNSINHHLLNSWNVIILTGSWPFVIKANSVVCKTDLFVRQHYWGSPTNWERRKITAKSFLTVKSSHKIGLIISTSAGHIYFIISNKNEWFGDQCFLNNYGGWFVSKKEMASHFCSTLYYEHKWV